MSSALALQRRVLALLSAGAVGLLLSNCSIELDSGSEGAVSPGAMSMEHQAVSASSVKVARVAAVVDSLSLNCGYSGDVPVSTPGAELHWSDVRAPSVEEATAVVVDHLVARGFRVVPDGAASDRAGVIYFGSSRAALELEVEGGATVRAAVDWIDPDRIGALERTAGVVPDRLVLSLWIEPNGC